MVSSRIDGLVLLLLRWAESNGLPCDASLDRNLAVFSPDRRHRYLLTRRLGAGDRVLAGIGANPSTADAFRNDPTIKRGMGFGAAWGCGLYVMLNAYGWRDTKPENMWAAWRDGADIVGEHNDLAIGFVLDQLVDGDIPLAAWGKIPTESRARQVAAVATTAGIKLQCLGVTKDGAPKHPLYLAASTRPEPWVAR